MWVQSLGREDSLEESTATRSSIPAWRIPWTEEPGGLQSMGWQRVGHDYSDTARTHAHTAGGYVIWDLFFCNGEQLLEKF